MSAQGMADRDGDHSSVACMSGTAPQGAMLTARAKLEAASNRTSSGTITPPSSRARDEAWHSGTEGDKN